MYRDLFAHPWSDSVCFVNVQSVRRFSAFYIPAMPLRYSGDGSECYFPARYVEKTSRQRTTQRV